MEQVRQDLKDAKAQSNELREKLNERVSYVEKVQERHDLDELEDDLNDLRKSNASTHERIFDKLTQLEKQDEIRTILFEKHEEKLDAVGKNIEEIKEKPGKRMNQIVEAIIGLIVAAVVGYFLAQLGLGP